jgi:hypothetical protein
MSEPEAKLWSDDVDLFWDILKTRLDAKLAQAVVQRLQVPFVYFAEWLEYEYHVAVEFFVTDKLEKEHWKKFSTLMKMIWRN